MNLAKIMQSSASDSPINHPSFWRGKVHLEIQTVDGIEIKNNICLWKCSTIWE